MNHKKKHGSLFSGIGGFDLAAEWMGWNNVFHCEWNEFGQKVLKYYWPKAISYGDITKTDFTIHRGNIDILTGGFPCQPYSLAGKRKGKDDERHLWPEMLRAIREIQPTWVVGENVFGLINWNGGLVFNEVQTDLEAEGYEVQPYVLPACAVNAPHRRDRVWFVAYSSSTRLTRRKKCIRDEEQKRIYERINGFSKVGITPDPNSNGHELRGHRKDRSTESEGFNEFQKRERIRSDNRGIGKPGITTDTESKRFASFYRPESEIIPTQKKQGLYGGSSFRFGRMSAWQNFPTQPPICSGNDGISSKLDGITFPKWRNESIKAMGNAIVPQVVFQIFKAIEEFEITEKE